MLDLETAAKTVFALLCIGVMAAVSFSAHANEEAPTYQAQTVDECIQEKECVWFHFIQEVYQASYLPQIYQRNYLSKRHENLKLRLGGSHAKKYAEYVVSVSDKLSPYFSHEMQLDFVHPNYTLMITDQFDQEVQKFKQALSDKNANKNTISALEKIFLNNPECFSVHLNKDNESRIYHTFTFVDSTKKDVKFCIASQFYSAFGLAGAVEGLPYSLTNTEQKNGLPYTKIDLFVLYLLSKKDFRSGQSFEEITDVFNKVFKEAQQEFLEIQEK